MNRPSSTTALVLAGRLEPRTIESLDARRLLRRFAPPLVFALLVLGAWQLYVVLAAVSESVLPSPVEVARALINDRGTLAPSAWTTLSEILIGYGVAIVVGVALALAGAAGSLLMPFYPAYPLVGQVFVLMAFVAVVLGTLGNIIGALIASLMMGVAESLGIQFVGADSGLIVVFAMLLLTLAVRPSGLFGGRNR